jgi:hypothetical protein
MNVHGMICHKSARRRVSRVLSRISRGWPFLWDARCRAPRATHPSGGAKARPVPRITPGYLPLLLGLAPGGVFPAAAVAGGAVRSYRTVSPLPTSRHRYEPAVYFLWHFPWGRPRRVLPGTVPPWSPDFPLPGKAEERPSSRLAAEDLGTGEAAVKGWIGAAHEFPSCCRSPGAEDCAVRVGFYKWCNSFQTRQIARTSCR